MDSAHQETVLLTLFQRSLKGSGFVLYTVSAMPDKHREGIEKSFQLIGTACRTPTGVSSTPASSTASVRAGDIS